MRDRIVGDDDPAYFDRLMSLYDEIYFPSADVRVATGKLARGLATPTDRPPDRSDTPNFPGRQLTYFKLLYSIGSTADHLREAYEPLPRWYARALDDGRLMSQGALWPDRFYDLVSVTSLAVLLDDFDGGALLGAAVKEAALEDFLLNFLLSRLTDRVEASSINGYETNAVSDSKRGRCGLAHDTFRLVAEIAQSDGVAASHEFATYMWNSWYDEHQWTEWHDLHKKRYRLLGIFDYAGYWSFEAAAVAKSLKLDDSLLEGNPYYPAGL